MMRDGTDFNLKENSIRAPLDAKDHVFAHDKKRIGEGIDGIVTRRIAHGRFEKILLSAGACKQATHLTGPIISGVFFQELPAGDLKLPRFHFIKDLDTGKEEFRRLLNGKRPVDALKGRSLIPSRIVQIGQMIVRIGKVRIDARQFGEGALRPLASVVPFHQGKVEQSKLLPVPFNLARLFKLSPRICLLLLFVVDHAASDAGGQEVGPVEQGLLHVLKRSIISLAEHLDDA